MKISLIQLDISFGSPENNYKKVETLIAEAMDHQPDILVLPELWTTGYDLTRLEEIGDTDASHTSSFITGLAQKYQVNIIAGSVAKKSGQSITNTLLAFNREGKLVKEYSKAHLFRLMDEEKFLSEGTENGLFELENTPSAGLICYDIRFPEWVRTHMLNDTKVLFVVAEWPKARLDHWRALLISRAIENQCFVIACNRAGADPNNTFAGHSMIIGPWGEIITEGPEEEAIVSGKINIEDVDEVRNAIPVFSDRRPNLYRL